MDRETVIMNLLNNYRKYCVSREVLEALIDSGLEEGLSYDLIYLSLKSEFSRLAGEEFYCTNDDIARAFGISIDEVNAMIEESRDELAANGENPDDYFMQTQSYRYTM